jgi:hypothetical protein
MFISADSKKRIPVYGNRAYYGITPPTVMTGRYLMMLVPKL